jgi:hypothetical protein
MFVRGLSMGALNASAVGEKLPADPQAPMTTSQQRPSETMIQTLIVDDQPSCRKPVIFGADSVSA